MAKVANFGYEVAIFSISRPLGSPNHFDQTDLSTRSFIYLTRTVRGLSNRLSTRSKITRENVKVVVSDTGTLPLHHSK